MPNIDLDALIAEQDGDQPEPKTFTFRSQTYTVPDRMPYAVFAASVESTQENVHAAVRSLLGGQFDAFIATGIDFDALIRLIPAIVKLYGADMGESQASGDSSANMATLSRPTSSSSTDSTSESGSEPIGSTSAA